MQRSPHYKDGTFHNLVAGSMIAPGSTMTTLRRQFFGDEQRVPLGEVPVVSRTSADFATPPASGLRATWIGHATVLVEIDGRRVLTDPNWSDYASPSSLFGPARLHAVPLPLDQVPPIDVVVVSHNHYDHLDMATIRALSDRVSRFVLPLGMGAHVEGWGVPAERIVELDWGESVEVNGLRVVSTPSRHYSGRGLRDADQVQWASWAVLGPTRRFYFSGDTGYWDGFRKIGAELGPFDLAIVKIGAYGETWPDIHVTPEQAVSIQQDVGGRLLLPVHWATFNLAWHTWSEPAERLVAAATEAGVAFTVPEPGQPVDVAQPPPVTPWWEAPMRGP